MSAPASDTRLRRALRLARRVTLAASVAFFLAVTFAIVDGWTAFGRDAEGARLERMKASPQFGDGVFENPQPMWNDTWGMFKLMFSGSDYASPDAPVAVETVDPERFATPPGTGLRVTWLGHSTMLLELDGHRILTDPVWGARSSPLRWVGPARWYAPPLALDALPPVDVVLVSHDHYDHLDYPTMTALASVDTTFVVPLGVAAHLVYWGVPEERIVELDWWDETTVGVLRIACTPARHASGRTLLDQNATLWASYALVGPAHRVWFSGDTGLFPALTEIGERFGPFDLTMIEAGAYGSAWPDWHLGPEQAVRAHRMVRGAVMLPVHWGLFDLAFHGWTEPIERVLVAADREGVGVIAPRPGQSIEPGAAPPRERWWPDVPWTTGEADPIVATRMDEG
jgi:L-ascorbate metabolism protein UlaG (beta-lactamase superfamily)